MALKPSLALLAVAALCGLAACGDDDSSDGNGSSESSETAAIAFETTEPSKGKVSIDAPETIEAGAVEITLKNSGDRPHDAQLIRVDGNRSQEAVISSTIDSEDGAPIPAWVHGAGGLGSVEPGESATVTQVLEPGTYYVLDSETGRGEGEGKVNARMGGVAKLEVTGETTGELPATDASITADEYSFETAGIQPGANRLTFRNAGKELHHVVVMPMRKGAKFADVTKTFASEEEPQGPPPVDFERSVSTAVLDGGEEQVTEIDFEPGKYALVCFITDRAGGPPHVAKGMIAELDVQ